jgi:Outer membrane lipoprotein-sorting protein
MMEKRAMKALIDTVVKTTAVCCLIMPVPLFAMDGMEFMKSVDDMYRNAFTTAVVKTQLATCKYEVKNGNISCREKPRITVLEVGEKKWGTGQKDDRSIALVLQPVTDKGVGLLTYEYYAPGRDNDVLLYLPALGKVRRLVSGNDGNEDGGSFFGTEFFSDDVQLMKIDQYTYNVLGEDTYDNRPVWVIEAIPTPERAKKTAYEKTTMWIDKDRKLILRQDIYNRSGKLYRQRLNKEFVKVDDVWIAKQQTMNNLVDNRISAIQNISVTYNKNLPDEMLTERSLTDFTFREKNLAILRTFYQ